MKIVYFGTPDFALLPLKRLHELGHEILALVTQLDKPSNRGKIILSPCKQYAIDNNIKVLQYKNIRREGLEDLKALNADVFITCAYGQILSQEIIDLPKLGIFNIHASLLPKHRGSSPIQSSILNNDKKTGITIMKTVMQVDAGDILLREEIDINENETAGELFDRLSVLGADAIEKAIKLLESGNYKLEKQNEKEATFCKMLKKTDGVINFNREYLDILTHIRAMTPWPSAYTKLNGKLLKIFEISKSSEVTTLPYGYMFTKDKHLYVSIKDNKVIEIISLQLEGSKRMLAKDYINGIKIDSPIQLGE